MNIPALTYLKIFEFLSTEFGKIACPEVETPRQIDLLLADKKVGRKRVKYSKIYFGCDFKYFVDRKTKAKKGEKVEIPNWRLVKMLEIIDNVPEGREYIGEDWENTASKMLKQFEKRFFQINEEELSLMEQTFLEVISKHSNVYFKPKIIELIPFGFFKAITEYRLIDAWNLLHPSLKEKSIWGSDFDNFRTMEMFIGSALPSITFFVVRSYKYREISFFLSIDLEVTLNPVNWFKKRRTNEDWKNVLREVGQNITNDKHALVWNGINRHLDYLDDENLEDFLFQLFCLTGDKEFQKQRDLPRGAITKIIDLNIMGSLFFNFDGWFIKEMSLSEPHRITRQSDH